MIIRLDIYQHKKLLMIDSVTGSDQINLLIWQDKNSNNARFSAL